MNQANQNETDPDLLDEYDFSAGVRGKYAHAYATGQNVIVLAPDVAEIFPDSQAVNDALRVLADLIRRRSGRPAG